MTMTKRQFLASAAALAVLPHAALAKTAQVYSEGTVAIDGTDAVAYFTQSKPVRGKSSITLKWNGAVWQFSSEENRAAFAANPEAYAPQYGGYCSYAVSEGYTASTTPEAWTIVDGKLYLNYSKRVRRIWSKDIPGRITKANANWPAVLN